MRLKFRRVGTNQLRIKLMERKNNLNNLLIIDDQMLIPKSREDLGKDHFTLQNITKS
jgi:hypothetical protein